MCTPQVHVAAGVIRGNGEGLRRQRCAGGTIQASGLDDTILHPAWLTGEDEVGYETTGRDEPLNVGSAASMRKEGEAKRSSVARSQSSMRLPSDTTP